jgi:hypothetical protein
MVSFELRLPLLELFKVPLVVIENLKMKSHLVRMALLQRPSLKNLTLVVTHLISDYDHPCR